MSDFHIARLTNDQLRTVLDTLYDGEPAAGMILLQINQGYRRSHNIFMWLARNNLRGTRLIEFFQNESGDMDGQGLLSGVTKILNDLDGQTGRLKAKELR